MSVAAARQRLGLPELPAVITLADVSKAFRGEAKRAHPDKVGRKVAFPAYEAAIAAASADRRMKASEADMKATEADMKLLSLAREVLARELARMNGSRSAATE